MINKRINALEKESEGRTTAGIKQKSQHSEQLKQDDVTMPGPLSVHNTREEATTI